MALLVALHKLLGIHQKKKGCDLGYLSSVLDHNDTSLHEGSSVVSIAVKK